jgi:hypothetical protein
MANRSGQRVKILGGMLEFVGKIGRILGKEGELYRVLLDEPVSILHVGKVEEDLWEGRMLRRVR